MKNLFKFVCLLFVTLFSYSYAQSPEDIGNALAQDEEFIELAQRLESYSEINKNIPEINRISNLEEVNEEERLNLMVAMGFESQEEAYDFDLQNFTLIQNFSERFGLRDFSPLDLDQTLTIGFNNVYSETHGNCVKRLKNCKSRARSIHVITAIGCGAAGATIGAGSFWCAGCLGLGVGAACITAAAVHMNSSISDCYLDFDECKD